MASVRGQSEIIGVVLLLAITIFTISGILILGAPALDQLQGQTETQKAGLVAGEFHKSLTLVANGGSPAQKIDTGDTPVSVIPRQGRIHVRSPNATFVNRSLGTVRFTHNDPQLIYQGGAIIYVNDGQAVLRQGPTIRYRAGTLGITLLSIRGDASTSQSILVSEGASELLSPSSPEATTDPIDADSFTVTVQSEYYRAWGSYLADQTGVTPSYDSANQTVSITFVPTSDNQPVASGIVSGTPNEALELTGGVSVDSYNSSANFTGNRANSSLVTVTGDVFLRGGGELQGGLRTDGNVTVEGGGRLSGPVTSGGDLTLAGGGTIDSDVHVRNDVVIERGTSFDGNLTYGGTLADPGGIVEDSTRTSVSADVPPVSPISGHMQLTTDFIKEENDNKSTLSINAGSLDCDRNDNDECRLTTGQYYLEEISLGSDEELVFDTTDGDITLVVDGDISLSGSATVRTIGDGRVNVYASGDYHQRGSSKVTNADDNATQFWVYLYPNATADLNGGGRFVGVIYGPGGSDAGVHIKPKIPIYGALVGDIDFVSGGTDIHYDTSLMDVQPVPTPNGTAAVTHLHARAVQVNVTNG